MRCLGWLSLLAASIAIPGTAAAQVGTGGCYATKSGRALTAYFTPVEQREVLVLVDRTVAYPTEVRDHVLTQVLRLVSAGTRVTIGSFSTQGHNTYPRLSLSYLFESDIPASLNRRVPRLHRDFFRRCLVNARVAGVQALRRTIPWEFGQATPSIPRSSIMISIQRFADRLVNSRARRKTLLIVSDMLENSTTASFYGRGGLRTIDPRSELAAARRKGVLANLGGAEVYVIGMELMPPTPGPAPADETVQRLEQFWRGYFAASAAGRVTVGHPMLLRDVQ